MLTLVICWKAVAAVVIWLLAIVLALGLFVGIDALIESDSPILEGLGWAILTILLFGLLVAMYFVFASKMCG